MPPKACPGTRPPPARGTIAPARLLLARARARLLDLLWIFKSGHPWRQGPAPRRLRSGIPQMATGDSSNGSPVSPPTDWRRQAAELLPAWFAERLAQEGTRFGVLLGTGHVLIVDQVRNVRAAPGGQVWLDVEIIVPFKKEGFPWGHFPLVKLSADERANSSINAAHIVAVVEVDTWEVPPLQPSND